jgi:hypothetical protein
VQFEHITQASLDEVWTEICFQSLKVDQAGPWWDTRARDAKKPRLDRLRLYGQDCPVAWTERAW